LNPGAKTVDKWLLSYFLKWIFQKIRKKLDNANNNMLSAS